MKGPSMHDGTSGHKDALKLNFSMDKTSLADGRAGSSALQYKTPAKAKTDPTEKGDGYTYGKEKMVKKTVTKNTKGGEDTKTDYETKGTKYTPPTKTEEGDKKYAAMSKSERKAADDKYIAANTKTKTKSRSEKSSTESKQTPIPKVGPKRVELKTSGKPEPIKAKETRKQKSTRIRKEREEKRSYTTVSDRSTFKRKVIKDKETGKERKVGKSGFGRAVENVTSKLKPGTRVKRRKVGRGKKRGGTSCSF